MARYHPVQFWYCNKEIYGRSTTYNRKHAIQPDDPKFHPCGGCVGCRLEKSRSWAVRCTHEASLYSSNCFLTLTYSPENLPKYGTLVPKHFTDFFKRLRHHCRGIDEVKYIRGDGTSVIDNPLRYYMCGEYGEKTARPHYHAILFNYDFDDKYVISRNRMNQALYSSDKLNEIWGHGFAVFGDVSWQSIAYVTRYVMKKFNNGSDPSKYIAKYGVFDTSTGELLDVKQPDYARMSNRPAIGLPWLQKYGTDVYPNDFVVINGQTIKPPKYYDILLERMNPELYDSVVENRLEKRVKNIKKILYESTAPRLHAREVYAESKVSRLLRPQF